MDYSIHIFWARGFLKVIFFRTFFNLVNFLRKYFSSESWIYIRLLIFWRFFQSPSNSWIFLEGIFLRAWKTLCFSYAYQTGLFQNYFFGLLRFVDFLRNICQSRSVFWIFFEEFCMGLSKLRTFWRAVKQWIFKVIFFRSFWTLDFIWRFFYGAIKLVNFLKDFFFLESL